MELSVTLEARFEVTPDGAAWTPGAFAYSFWNRYLPVFESVKVIARARSVSEPSPGMKRVDGASVRLHALPHYIGVVEFARRVFSIRRELHSAFAQDGAVVLRVPSQIGVLALSLLRPTGRPYGLEVVGDPLDVFSSGAVQHPLSRLFRWWAPRHLRRQCAGASSVAYVTEETLQKRYPCRGYTVAVSDAEISTDALVDGPVFWTTYSSVELNPLDCVTRPRAGLRGRLPRMITVGALEQMYKGTDVLIEAVAICARAGLDLDVTVIGGGRCQPELQAMAQRCGVGERIHFRGQVPAGQTIRDALDECDLFVLPSRTEGLPRAMIEAMARGLPCIGSAVGGIPELLEPDELVPPGDPGALAHSITAALSHSERLSEMSARNLAKANRFREDVLRPKRLAFLHHLRAVSREWQSRQFISSVCAPYIL